MSSCPFGRRSLSAISNANNIVFSTPTVADVENPLLFPFTNIIEVLLLVIFFSKVF
jgi:hypothetical protein